MKNTKKPNLPSEHLFPSAFALFKPSLTIARRNIPSMLLFIIVPFVFASVGTYMTWLRGDTTPLASMHGMYGLWLFLGYLIALLTLPAAIFFQLKSAQGSHSSPDDALTNGFRYLPRMIGLLICIGLIFAVSLLLLIVPFFFMLRRYILAPYYLVDQNLGVFATLKASAADSKQYSAPIWQFIGVQVLLEAVNIIPGVGKIIASIANIAYTGAGAVRYEQIKAAKAGKAPLAPLETTTAS
jgi:hypothetical protein